MSRLPNSDIEDLRLCGHLFQDGPDRAGYSFGACATKTAMSAW